MEFHQVDVFADGPFLGNPLAVFPEADDLTTVQMQTIAREMNLSETSFVTARSDDAYDVRIFTPTSELPFAGHPTLGTAWVLMTTGRVNGLRVRQRSKAGTTWVTLKGSEVWLERDGEAALDLDKRSPQLVQRLAEGLSLDVADIGCDASGLGMRGPLRPAFATAGLQQLMVPVRDGAALRRVRITRSLSEVVSDPGAYCFTPAGPGRMRARGLWPGLGVPEDPATGAAAAALGVYLADRLGPLKVEVIQGEQISRPSRLLIDAEPGRVLVGGRCVSIFRSHLDALPNT